MKSNYLIIDSFTPGFQKRRDESSLPIGALRSSINLELTEREGLSPRKGEALIGEAGTGSGIKSAWSFKKAEGNDILLKTYEDKIEYYNNESNAWCLLKDGYTSGKEFAFKEHKINTDATDLLYFCNGYEPYSRWNGYESKLNGDLVGGETEIIVDSVLKEKVHYTGTAASCTTTSITISLPYWATDLWNDFYVRITDGTKEGYISKISATTTTEITFDAIAGLTGTPTFEIRLLAVDATGSIIYNGTSIAYTSVPRDDRFTVSSAHAADSGTGITTSPIEYTSVKRGNLLETSVAQMFLAGVEESPDTVFRSALEDATDFTFSSPRSADEGDVIFFPYGGKKITDIKAQEDTLYVFKPHSIESLTYTQDADDIAIIAPINKSINIGTEAKTWKVQDDILFATPDKRITSLGRVENKDTLPQTSDLAYPIRRELQLYNLDSVSGGFLTSKSYIAVKSNQDVQYNDRVLVYNHDHSSWEGYSTISASVFVLHNGKIYYGDAYNPDLYELNSTINKTKGDTVYPLSCSGSTGFINLRGSGFYLNEVYSLAVEGYITSGTTINFRLYKDFAQESFQELQLTGLETEFQDNVPTFNLLGGDPNGIEPLGANAVLGEQDDTGRRHFIAILYFQITQVEYLSIGVGSSGLNQDWEIIKLGVNLTEPTFEKQTRNKN